MHIRSFFVLGGALLLIAANDFAGPKEDVAAATAKWGETLGQDDPDKVLALYAADAVLWGTLSLTVRSDRAALRDYFVNAFKVLPGLKVSLGEQLIRVYGNTAINTGYYTFAYTKDGEPKTLPARYSIVFVKEAGIGLWEACTALRPRCSETRRCARRRAAGQTAEKTARPRSLPCPSPPLCPP